MRPRQTLGVQARHRDQWHLGSNVAGRRYRLRAAVTCAPEGKVLADFAFALPPLSGAPNSSAPMDGAIGSVEVCYFSESGSKRTLFVKRPSTEHKRQRPKIRRKR